jgi:hypothetical protein
MEKKKSQAALEFLTTYGWAFIVILTAIGAMTYLGVLNPIIFIPDKCFFGTDFECKDSRLVISQSTNDHFADFILVNSIGDTIAVTSVNCTFPNKEDVGVEQPYPLPSEWYSGNNQSFRCRAFNMIKGGGLVLKEKQKVKVIITYKFGPQGFPHISEGEILTTVQQIS